MKQAAVVPTSVSHRDNVYLESEQTVRGISSRMRQEQGEAWYPLAHKQRESGPEFRRQGKVKWQAGAHCSRP